MYCKSCGSENDDGARFCRDCGRAITGSSPRVETGASADGGDTPDAVEAPAKANTWIWVAGIAGLVAVLLFAGLIALVLAATSGSSRQTDREALEVLFQATSGHSWLESKNWLTDAPLGEWTGVTTDEDGRVTGLDLGANELSGRIPPELGNLDRLRTLDLAAERTVTTLRGGVRITFGGDSPSLSSQLKQAGRQLAESAETSIRRNYLSGCIPTSLREQLDMSASDLGGLPFCDGWSAPTGDITRAGPDTTPSREGTEGRDGPPKPAQVADNRPPAPENVRYVWDESTIIVTWDASEGAEYYTIYHDDFFDNSCTVVGDGTPAFCEELASNVRENSYVHADPDGGENHYWVTACVRDGCSEIDSHSPAEYVDTRPASPTNVRVQFVQDGTQIQVSWDPVPDAGHYKIYYDDFFGDNCRVDRFGDASFCDLLASDIRQTSYLHARPARDENYYWVVACNSGGCSDVDRENPAVPADSSRSATAPAVSPSPEPSETATEPDASRRSFEASTPPGYTRVMLTDQGSVWGTPERFTTDSRLGAVAYMLLGSVKGCSFAREELRRSSIVHIKVERLGRLATYESGDACGKTSRKWDTGWEGMKMARLRIFDESSPANVREYVYDQAAGEYVESPASGDFN